MEGDCGSSRRATTELKFGLTKHTDKDEAVEEHSGSTNDWGIRSGNTCGHAAGDAGQLRRGGSGDQGGTPEPNC